jgi:hypothetical protein
MKHTATLLTFAAFIALAAPARAAEQVKPEVNSGFGVALFTNQSPAGFNDPADAGSNAAVASVADQMSDIAPAAGDENAAPTPEQAAKAAAVIAPAVSGETRPLAPAGK